MSAGIQIQLRKKSSMIRDAIDSLNKVDLNGEEVNMEDLDNQPPSGKNFVL